MSGFQQSLEAESEGILLVDTSTPDWNILFQNEAWLRITGMTREAVLGGKLWQLFSPAGQTKVQTQLLAQLLLACACASVEALVCMHV